ncbi:MAG: rRNA pseudouridine synthase [Candidatus Wallbacteria bacterium]|nr:rRNA pseudouridine synthase [Candidatus Wallbacteria bacterium]
MRLQRFLSMAGVASRRQAEELIREGSVRVNGKTADIGMSVDPRTDRVTVEGKRIQGGREPVYLALHKPREVICTRDDPQGRRTVMEFVPPGVGLVSSVGRLDYHSSGLLLLTNDGELANRLAKPASEVPKIYRVKAAHPFEEEAARRFREGVPLDGIRTLPAKLRALADRSGFWYEVALTEGRNRQVRRMFEALGNRVQKLTRVAIGPVELGKLKPGEVRPLTPGELQKLQEAAGLAEPKSRKRKKGWALPKSRRPAASGRTRDVTGTQRNSTTRRQERRPRERKAK